MDRKIILAIKRGIKLGKVLRDEHPEIRNMYAPDENGNVRHNQLDIIKFLGLREEYRVTQRIAENAIGYALRGYKGREGSYNGLATQEEMSRWYKLHMKEEGRKKRENKVGFNSHSNEERRGFYLQGLKKMGFTLWNNDERMFAFKLYTDERYFHPNGRGNASGKPDYLLIAKEINRVCHGGKEIRTGNAVKRQIQEIKKRKF